MAAYPMTMGEYYSMQDAMASNKVHSDVGESDDGVEEIEIQWDISVLDL